VRPTEGRMHTDGGDCHEPTEMNARTCQGANVHIVLRSVLYFFFNLGGAGRKGVKSWGEGVYVW
jgi:hypothetical protein